MNRRTRQVGYFLSSQYFSDGVRITLSILLPSLLFRELGQLETGMALSLGALNVSIADAPGPVMHRRNGMLTAVLCGFLVTLATGFARLNPYVMGFEILLFSFFFSMFAMYGNRATSVGTAALLIMILMLDRPLNSQQVLVEAGLVMAGGVWYTSISLLASQLQPYRLAEQALGQCIHETAKLMAIKADFYQISSPIDDAYRRLIAQQVVVSEKQDAVREVLFKSRRIVTESTRTGRVLLLTFIDMVDLYEQIIAMYYDYRNIRERFGKSGVLENIAQLIRQLSAELDHIGLAIQSPVPFHKSVDISGNLESLKRCIDGIGEEKGSTLVLRKVLVSLRTVSQRLNTIQKNILKPDDEPLNRTNREYGRFVSHVIIDFKSFRNNLTTDSSVFRHSVRVALAMLIGFILTKLLPYGHYSYWVLLTISVILKPAFSLTRQRNVERIIGTFAGGIMGLLILTFIPNKTVHFVFLVLFMLGTYSSQRINYIAMVICVTPFVLILFSFLGVGYLGVAQERLLDTLMGGGIALLAGYLFFPQWESEQLNKPMQDLLKANLRYVQLLLDSLSGRRIDVIEYRLVRKEVYITSANLSAAFERMVSEPKHKQRNEKLIYEFVVLNYILSANIATIMSARLTDNVTSLPVLMLRPVKRALFALTESLTRLGMYNIAEAMVLPAEAVLPLNQLPDDTFLNEQLQFIQQVSSDIGKLVERIKSGKNTKRSSRDTLPEKVL
ncbi:FUSC family protein [Spirosoma sp. BT702]|uniref:FUSC family protein n=1 Tax=Spirosoma profusum TaxID=2771354 RepID=A0A926Y0E7_9BACT|nr:FUSC family membrane protein [Spirosoma profusum]MBD2701612.1 FUSC family protein [Spirosoma profusum]